MDTDEPLTDKQLWQMAKVIQAYIYRVFATAAPDCKLFPFEKTLPNPFFGQLTQGLWLEMYYGIPGAILTPWGRWGCFGSGFTRGDWEPAFWAALREHLELVEIEPLTSDRDYGPVYRIVAYKGHKLPEGRRKEMSDGFLTYDEVKRILTSFEAEGSLDSVATG